MRAGVLSVFVSGGYSVSTTWHLAEGLEVLVELISHAVNEFRQKLLLTTLDT